jgi:Na+-driven multidrug efflux pump
VSQLTWVVFIGLGNGVAVLIGKKIGEGKEQEARDYASRITRFSPIVSIGAILILLPITQLLPFVFNVNASVLATATQMFIILCCAYPFRAFNMAAMIGVCRAGGDTIFCIFYDIAFMWILALPLGAVAAFVFNAPVWVIYLCINSEETFKTLLGLWRIKTGKWLHNVVN